MTTPTFETWLNPDCRDGKHLACSGTAWNNAADELTLCSCSCHPPVRPIPDDADLRIRQSVMAAVRGLPAPTAVTPAPAHGWDPGAARVARPVDVEYVICWVVAAAAIVWVLLLCSGVIS